MTPTDPTETTPAQEAVAAPPAPEATGTDAPPPRGKGRPAKAKPGARKGKGKTAFLRGKVRGKAGAKKASAAKGKTTARTTPAKPIGQPGRKIGPEARSQAYQLLAEGFSCSAVARDLKVKVDTVIGWRDSPEGEKEIRSLREQRNVELGATLRQARQDLELLIPRAIKALGDSLASSNPNVKVRAAAQILDRGGLPRTEVHEEHTGELDLSGLSPEELDQLRALHAKAARGAA